MYVWANHNIHIRQQGFHIVTFHKIVKKALETSGKDNGKRIKENYNFK